VAEAPIASVAKVSVARHLFFAVDSDQTSRLSAAERPFADAPLETSPRDHGPSVIAIPATASRVDASSFRALQIFAFPLLTSNVALVGVIDVSRVCRGEILGEREEAKSRPACARFRDDVFLSPRISYLEQISAAHRRGGFRFRFPWFAVHVAAGTICANPGGAV